MGAGPKLAAGTGPLQEGGLVAERFVVDTEQAQQVTERLLSVNGSIAGLQQQQQQQDIGSGILEEAMSEFTSRIGTAHGNLATAIDNAATNFDALRTGAITLDQQEAGMV
jgi:hypothetical protein